MSASASAGSASGRGSLLVGDKGRNMAVELVKRANTAGQLSLDELEARLVVILAARTRMDLRPALEDLPDYRKIRAQKRFERYWLD
jgi:hypothetical protein